MKKIFSLAFLLISLTLFAQKQEDPKYLSGAVPEVNGRVQFDKTYKTFLPESEAFAKLFDYVQKNLVEGENSLEQSRIMMHDTILGTIVANIEERLYFRRSALVTHSTRFFYQIVVNARDNHFDISLRNLHYMYDEAVNAGLHVEDIRAENWITDRESLNKKKTKLLRVPGKFRRATIDRKDEIFRGAAKSVGALTKKKIEVEVEE